MDYKETAALRGTGALWLPPGADAYSSTREKEAAKAVESYDHSLILGHRRDTNEWIVFAKRGPEGQPFPVFTFGSTLPHPDEIQKKLYESDVARHGVRVITAIQRKADERRKEEKYAQDEQQAAADEVLDRALYNRSDSKIYVPGRD